jgi:mannose-6-phosphate isomerase-like protein (cupin superfamily)
VSEPDISFAALDRDSSERFQTLRRELDLSSFGLNLMVLQPGQRGRIHAHEHQEEVYVVLEGELSLSIEGTEHLLGPDSSVRVAPTVRRQLANAGHERVVVLAIGGFGEHRGRDGHAWTSWDQQGPGARPQEIPLPADLPVR